MIDNEALGQIGEISGLFQPRSITIPVTTARAEGIVKEPSYNGTPHYGRIRLGDGPRAETIFVMDRTSADKRALNRLYLDRNQNGDLTDDGNGEMQSVGKNLPGARVGPHFDVLRASWGNATEETSSGSYGLMFLFGVDRGGGSEAMLVRTAAARTGYIDLEGKVVRVVLVEVGATGVFDFEVAARKESTGKEMYGNHAYTLLVDSNGDGQFNASEVFDATRPIAVGASTYLAGVTRDGARLTLTPTTLAAQVVTPPVRARASAKDSGLLKAGTLAPDFTARTADGIDVSLSSLRGKVVVLDFWATWCIPCLRSMPHVEKTVAKVTGQEVVVLGVCVWDDPAAFARWVTANGAKYSFLKVLDPAGKNRSGSIATRHYLVSGIPTLYVIDREGRIVDGLVGFLGNDDDRLANALAKASLKR